MRLQAPKLITFWIAVALVIIGILATLISMPPISGFAFWFVVIGFIVLAAGNLVNGL